MCGSIHKVQPNPSVAEPVIPIELLKDGNELVHMYIARHRPATESQLGRRRIIVDAARLVNGPVDVGAGDEIRTRDILLGSNFSELNSCLPPKPPKPTS